MGVNFSPGRYYSSVTRWNNHCSLVSRNRMFARYFRVRRRVKIITILRKHVVGPKTFPVPGTYIYINHNIIVRYATLSVVIIIITTSRKPPSRHCGHTLGVPENLASRDVLVFVTYDVIITSTRSPLPPPPFINNTVSSVEMSRRRRLHRSREHFACFTHVSRNHDSTSRVYRYCFDHSRPVTAQLHRAETPPPPPPNTSTEISYDGVW